MIGFGNHEPSFHVHGSLPIRKRQELTSPYESPAVLAARRHCYEHRAAVRQEAQGTPARYWGRRIYWFLIWSVVVLCSSVVLGVILNVMFAD